MSLYILGGDVISALPARPVFPSVSEYPIEAAREMIEEVENVIGTHHGLWPRGNYVWPGVELEEELRKLPENWEYAMGAITPIVKLWEGTTEDLRSRLDFERAFDEGFDDAMIRRTGKMRGGG